MNKSKDDIASPVCPYCNRLAELVDSAEVYNGTSYGPVWLCRQCGAYVGVHKNSKRFAPLGELATKLDRIWRMKTHRAFDDLWKRKVIKDDCSKGEARASGYRWLASELNIEGKQCHIGKFSIDTCKRVVELCKRGKR